MIDLFFNLENGKKRFHKNFSNETFLFLYITFVCLMSTSEHFLQTFARSLQIVSWTRPNSKSTLCYNIWVFFSTWASRVSILSWRFCFLFSAAKFKNNDFTVNLSQMRREKSISIRCLRGNATYRYHIIIEIVRQDFLSRD